MNEEIISTYEMKSAPSFCADLVSGVVDPAVWEKVPSMELDCPLDGDTVSASFKAVRIDDTYYLRIYVKQTVKSHKSIPYEFTTEANHWFQDCVEIMLAERGSRDISVLTDDDSKNMVLDIDEFRHIRCNIDGALMNGNYNSEYSRLDMNVATVEEVEDGYIYNIAMTSGIYSASDLNAGKYDGIEMALEMLAVGITPEGKTHGVSYNLRQKFHRPASETLCYGILKISPEKVQISESELKLQREERVPCEDIRTSTEISLETGEKHKIVYTLLPKKASQVLSFSSSDEKVATVTSKGLVMAVGEGDAEICITAESGVEATVSVTVTPVFIVDGTPDYIGKTEVSPYTPPEKIKIGENTYTLSFYDDFSGTELDPNKWVREPEWRRKNKPGWWLHEASYLNGKGQLVIDNKKVEVDMNRSNAKEYYAAHPDCHSAYASGAVSTEGIFTQAYGYWEISCKIPKVTGFWGAFWLLSDGVADEDTGGEHGCEIDIFEALVPAYPAIYSTIHFNGYGAKHRKVGGAPRCKNFYDSYHTVALEWTHDDYIVYIDGRKVWKASDAKNDITQKADYEAMRICKDPLHMVICSEFGDWAGETRDDLLPAPILCDYVRVYALDK